MDSRSLDREPVLRLSVLRLVNFVENAPIVEKGLLSFGPTAENAVDGKQLNLRELPGVFLGDFRCPWPIEILRGDFLSLGRVEIFKIGRRHLACSLPVDNLIDDAYRRFRQNADAWIDDFELVRTKLFQAQEGVTLPGNENITEAALDECGCGATSSRVKDRHVLVEFGDEIIGLLLVISVFLQGETPRRQKIPSSSARSFGVRCNDLNAWLDKIVPVFDAFRISLSNEEVVRGCIRTAVVREPLLPVLR